SGQLDTQNTPEGMVTDFSQLKARSGALSASGRARVVNRHIEADLAVDLVDGVIGVPLKVSGPLEQVQVSVPAGAVAGAMAGTAVLPGIGTAIGARIGATLGKLFGGEPEGKKKLAPVEK
ncbi:MAG: glycine zipper domain-containing protein, partial [Polaromonas sp.]